MPPAMYLHWLIGLGTNAACLSCFFANSSKVRRRFETRSSVPGFTASNPKQPRKVHARSRERQRVKRIRNVDRAQASCRSVACASKEKAKLVRPDEAGPHNSTRDPRGNRHRELHRVP